MKQLEVSIMGQSSLLACTEGGEAALSRAVAAVDAEMCAIRDAGKVRARERIAVLAALNLAYQLAEQGPSAEAVEAPGAAGVALPPQQVDALVQRLDHALGADGQLL
ncbi:MAG: cell division protein ZapA [Pseudomonadota bacterium]